MVYADEMNFPIGLTFNPKNDVIMVNKGEQSSTNIHRGPKGQEGKFCSLFLVINGWGVVCYHVFFVPFTKEFYQQVLLREILKPRLAALKAQRRPCSFYYHDGATNADLHDDEKLLEEVFESSTPLPFAPSLCREAAGREYIEPMDRRPYWRRKTVPCDECECIFDEFAVPSASPDLNLDENANGRLRSIWQQQCGRNGPLSWSGGRKRRMRVIDECVKILDSEKAFFKKLYENAHKRHTYMIETSGDRYKLS